MNNGTAGVIPWHHSGLKERVLDREYVPTGNVNTTPGTQIPVHMVLPVPILPIGRVGTQNGGIYAGT